MYIINQQYQEAATAFKNLNIRSNPKTVGEWVTTVEYKSLNDVPINLACFSLEDWLKKLKPKLKEGAQYHKDY